jgi:hypothetical protein
VTGYNHFSNCTCGWCEYTDRDRGRTNHTGFISEFQRRDAEALLQRNLVNSISGCYLNPNARCPVCAAPVFFYANKFGSKVYFDDLGPPWPKHPCTDTPAYKGRSADKPNPIVERPRGAATELVNAATLAGRRPEQSRWKLMRVEDVWVEGEFKKLRLRSLQLDDETLAASVADRNCNIDRNDIVNFGEGRISYFDMSAFEPRTILASVSVAGRPTEGKNHIRSLIAAWRTRGLRTPDLIANVLNKSRTKSPWGGDWTAKLVLKFMNEKVELKGPISNSETARAPRRRSRKKQKSRHMKRFHSGVERV